MPGLNGWATGERLLQDLAPLQERLWLVIDDVHEMGTGETLRQLKLLVLQAPPELRFCSPSGMTSGSACTSCG